MEFPIKRRFLKYKDIKNIKLNTQKKLDSCEEKNIKGTKIRIFQYNILAQALMNRKKGFFYVSKSSGKWKFRRNNLLKEIKNMKADILCIQEMDHFEDFWKKELHNIGFDFVYNQTINAERSTSEKKIYMPYGVMIAFRKDKFKKEEFELIKFNNLKHKEDISLLEKKELDFSNNISQLLVLSLIGKKDTYICINNTHDYWRPGYEFVRFSHWMHLHEKLELTMKRIETEKKIKRSRIIPLMIGDFNLFPNDLPIVLQQRERNLANLKKYMDYFKINEYIFEHYAEELKGLDHENLKKERDESINKQLTNFIKNAPYLFSVYSNYLEIDKDADVNKHISKNSGFDYDSYNAFTNYRPGFQHVLDYIFFHQETLATGNIKIESVLEIPNRKHMEKEVALPNSLFSSDHVCIGCEISIQ